MRILFPGLMLLLATACGSSGEETASPSPPPPDVIDSRTNSFSVPETRVTPTTGPDHPLYIALGDSLSEGVGSSDPASTAFVPLVHAALDAGVGLLNLGHSGDTSGELLSHGHLDEAVAEIESRNGDGKPGNDVTLVTLEIGGNDLLNIFFDLVLPGTCPTITESLQKPECVDTLQAALADFEPNLKQVLDSLQAADPDLRIVLLTLYNPFSGGGLTGLDPLGTLSLEGMSDTPFPEGLNDIIRAEAAESGVILVDVYPLFEGKASEYVAMDLIHPNDAGYRVMADAVLAALEP